ncbi:galactose oxidase [Meira miltonrushii]|uniref:Galactose oxidase n=1 Tax=Meira miltonrushii TaxID=1280837 RepID=A0A316V9A8_9BASI|nr:galactose oxidase [Meira miltonrushii]PWN33051.1 galactose oxidase [Meira miltonrushii]
MISAPPSSSPATTQAAATSTSTTATSTSTSTTSSAASTYTVVNDAPINGPCPQGATSYTAKNNVVYTLCPNSNYDAGNLANIAAKDIQTCAEICSTTPGCYNVVYEPGTCHIKGAPYQPNLKASNYYSTVTATNTTANNKALASLNGQWGNVIPLDVNPVAAYLVPAYPTVKEFLSFASWSPSTFGGPANYQTAFASFDITSNTQGEFTVANTQHNMFCPGMNSLPDGRLIIDGGDTDQAVTLYDPFANTFTRAANMTMGRGYQSSVLLSNGKTFTIGGSFTGGIGGQDGVPMKDGEVYDSTTNQWSPLSGALVQPMLTTYDNAGAWRTDNHAWLFAWSGGSVFQAGPSKNMNWYSTAGSGGVQSAGVRNSNNDQMCGISVMYDNGKILSTGGAQSYSDNNALNVAHLITLNGVNASPTVEQVQSMNYARSFHNAIVLPNGQIFIAGGQSYAEVFTDVQSVLQAEIFDPTTKTFTTVAPASIPRNYHSSTVLLPDGRVMSGGGGLCYVGGNCNNANHQDIQFYTPPYLFDSNGNLRSRPTVNSITSSQQQAEKVRVNPGGTLTVNLSSASGLTHVLVRMGSSTHSIDTDQRRIPLTVQNTSGNTVTLAIPNDNGIVPPGFWYYFAVASNGVHSIGLTVNVLTA